MSICVRVWQLCLNMLVISMLRLALLTGEGVEVGRLLNKLIEAFAKVGDSKAPSDNNEKENHRYVGDARGN